MKCIAWLLVILLSLPAFAYTENEPFYTQVVGQPVKLKDSTLLSDEDAEHLISPEGMVSPKLMDSVHDDLSGGYRVADMDVAPNRIVLLLDTTDYFLIRIAQWDAEGQTYVIVDWPGIPNASLDTYHDGGAVFAECSNKSFSDSEPAILVTLEELDGLWHVTRFTDAMTYSAEKTETGYLFCDYWDYESEKYQHHFISPTQLEKITWTDIIRMVDEYNRMFPQRPALTEAWDEVDDDAERENNALTESDAPMLVQDQLTGQSAIINASGEFIVPFTADNLELFQIGSAVFCIQRSDDTGRETYALCDAYRMLTDFDFMYIQTTYAGDYPILATDSDCQNGFIDTCGQWIVPPAFYYAEPFSEGVALVQTEDSLGYINLQGEYVLKYTYDELSVAVSFSEGVAAVEYKTGLWGYIDVHGERIINDYYADANSFSCGFARVSDGAGYYFIDHHGNTLGDTRFSYASDFLYGYAIVGNESRQRGIVSTTGELVFPIEADSIINITPDHFCWIQSDDSTLYGLYNLSTASFVCSDKYEMPFPFGEGFVWNEEGFIVKKNGLFGYLSKQGSLLLPCQYAFLGMSEEGTLLGLSDDNHRYQYFQAEKHYN